MNLKSKAISEIRSTILTLSAHPHNEPHSEFADRIEGLQVLLGELEAEQGGKGVPTEQEIKQAAKAIARIIIPLSKLESQIHQQLAYDGVQWAISQMQPEWVEVTPETKPEPGKYYFALFKAVNGKYIKCVATYTEGWDLEVDGNDDGDHFNLDEVNEQAFMKKGWYECCEQQGGDYDEMYFKRDVVFYLPNIVLPQPPTK